MRFFQVGKKQGVKLHQHCHVAEDVCDLLLTHPKLVHLFTHRLQIALDAVKKAGDIRLFGGDNFGFDFLTQLGSLLFFLHINGH